MIDIFLDTSGSMSVMGKNNGAIYIIKSIEDYCNRMNIETVVYKFDKTKIDDIHALKFNDILAIDNFEYNKNSILISDGLFDSTQENVFDIAFSIGIDANQNKLEKISWKVNECENIILGLEYLIYKNDISNYKSDEKEDDNEW